MARKTAADSADKSFSTDKSVRAEGTIKYVSEIADFHFVVPVIGEDGKPEFHTDANGNNRVPTTKMYHFTVAHVRDPVTGKLDHLKTYSFFVADPKVHGRQFDVIVKALNDMMKNPGMYKLRDDDGFFAHRNPEAYRIAKEKLAMEETISEKDRRIAELEQRLGFKKQG
jgi:hypothetical protein